MRRLIGVASSHLIPLLVAPALLAVACGSDDYSDESFGVLNLASVYEGATLRNPAAGLPAEIAPKGAFIDERRAEFYDFGTVVTQRSDATGDPTAARVRPMYFFFDAAGRPMFSRPARDQRDGTDWMRGGKGVQNPNPKDHCAELSSTKPPAGDPRRSTRPASRAISGPMPLRPPPGAAAQRPTPPRAAAGWPRW